MVSSRWRGNEMYCVGDKWFYSSDNLLVSMDKDRKCEYCRKDNTIEGHDACLGTLPGLMNACCGHGNVSEAFVQFLDGFCVRELDAITIINILKEKSNGSK